ncbi:hypothetical protein Cadr_000012035 [Camelus dromedarius]|uniref:Uncharacterized protein n=1 Tax=Camelus dromedarius TaxID=9838 RepID=A0A5N4DPU9_CAMDR|nr:hypothetical protein Cadr_000012035 [Camelus dromedarius]KAB1273142.1 hypothetical protein Cadr_000012035 [Camelus dromedarius]
MGVAHPLQYDDVAVCELSHSQGPPCPCESAFSTHSRGTTAPLSPPSQRPKLAEKAQIKERGQCSPNLGREWTSWR